MESFHSDLRASGENNVKVKAGTAPGHLPEGTQPVPGGGRRGPAPDAGMALTHGSKRTAGLLHPLPSLGATGTLPARRGRSIPGRGHGRFRDARDTPSPGLEP